MVRNTRMRFRLSAKSSSQALADAPNSSLKLVRLYAIHWDKRVKPRGCLFSHQAAQRPVFASAIDNHSHLGHLRPAAWYRTALMIVCVCNRLNEAKIRGAIACGASSPDQVYAHNGVRRICGTCQETITAMLQEHEPQEQLQAAE